MALELVQRRLGGERVDEPHVRNDELDLAALELPDEIPLKALTMGADLRLEVLCAVLADDADARLGQDVHLLDRDVLGRRAHLDRVGVAPGMGRGAGDLPADALEVAPHAASVEPADQLRHTTPAWRPVTPPSRRCEKNSPGLEHIVHRPGSCTSATPAASS